MTRTILLLPMWGLALWAALAIRDLPGDWGHALCGPWGCAPPVQALAGVHAAWAVLLWPLAGVVALTHAATPVVRRRIGLALAAIAVAAAVGIAIRESVTWAPTFGNGTASYLPHRVAFVLATTVDAPILQLLVAGLIVWWSASRDVDHFDSSGEADERPTDAFG